MKYFLNIFFVTLFLTSNVFAAPKFLQGDLWKSNDITKTYTPPPSSDELLGKDSVQIIQNKDYDGGTAANNRRVTIPKNTKANLDALTNKEGTIAYGTDTGKAYLNNGSAWVPIGSGSGGGVNYITDGDAENVTTSIFIPYQDSSGTRPIDGTGGTTTGITTDVTTSSPLQGSKSFRLIKDAANRQGGGWAIPFSIDSGYRSDMNRISVQYRVSSGNFIAGSSSSESDVIWYLYDITNAKLLEPQSIKMLTSSNINPDTFRADFQPNYVAPGTSSNYRLVAHIQSNSALAYTLMVDNITVNPVTVNNGPTITDWRPYLASISAQTGTLTNYTVSGTEYAQIGQNLFIKGRLTFTGAPGTWSFPVISFPPGINAESNIQAYSGKITYTDTGTNGYGGDALPFGTTGITLAANRGTNGANISINQAAPFAWANTDIIDWTVGPIKISGWTSNSQISDDYQSRNLRVNAVRSGTNLTGIIPNNSAVKLAFGATSVEDTYNGWDSANNRVLIRTSKDYDLSFAINLEPTNQIGAEYIIGMLFRNGIEIASTQMEQVTTGAPRYMRLRGSVTGYSLNAGDYLELYLYSTANHTSAALSASYLSLNIKANQSSNNISATPVIASSFYANSISSTAGVAFSGFAGKTFDTFNMVNLTTGEIKIPVSGIYRITAPSIRTASPGQTLNLWKSGVNYRPFYSWTAATYWINGSVTLECVAGDILTIRPDGAVTVSGMYVDVEKIK